MTAPRASPLSFAPLNRLMVGGGVGGEKPEATDTRDESKVAARAR